MIVDKTPPSRGRSVLPPSQRRKLIKRLRSSYKKIDLIAKYAKIQQQKAIQEAEQLLNKNKNLFD